MLNCSDNRVGFIVHVDVIDRLLYSIRLTTVRHSDKKLALYNISKAHLKWMKCWLTDSYQKAAVNRESSCKWESFYHVCVGMVGGLILYISTHIDRYKIITGT